MHNPDGVEVTEKVAVELLQTVLSPLRVRSGKGFIVAVTGTRGLAQRTVPVKNNLALLLMVEFDVVVPHIVATD